MGGKNDITSTTTNYTQDKQKQKKHQSTLVVATAKTIMLLTSFS